MVHRWHRGEHLARLGDRGTEKGDWSSYLSECSASWPTPAMIWNEFGTWRAQLSVLCALNKLGVPLSLKALFWKMKDHNLFCRWVGRILNHEVYAKGMEYGLQVSSLEPITFPLLNGHYWYVTHVLPCPRSPCSSLRLLHALTHVGDLFPGQWWIPCLSQHPAARMLNECLLP